MKLELKDIRYKKKLRGKRNPAWGQLRGGERTGARTTWSKWCW